MSRPFGSFVSMQLRNTGSREFQFFRDSDGNPWLTVKTQKGEESYCFREDEFAAFLDAGQKLRNS